MAQKKAVKNQGGTRAYATKDAAAKRKASKPRRLTISVEPLTISGLVPELDKIAAGAGDAILDRMQEQFVRDEQLRHDNVMTQAQAVIYGEREKTYGRPEVNLHSIAEFWSIYLKRKGVVQGDPTNVTIDDVCQMMVLLKSARLLNDPGHHDSQVDQIGYIGLQERCRGR